MRLYECKKGLKLWNLRGGKDKNRPKKGRDEPKWPARAKIRGDRVQGWEIGEGRTNERAETDLNGRGDKVREGNRRRWDERKGRDGPKWPARTKLKSVIGWRGEIKVEKVRSSTQPSVWQNGSSNFVSNSCKIHFLLTHLHKWHRMALRSLKFSSWKFYQMKRKVLDTMSSAGTQFNLCTFCPHQKKSLFDAAWLYRSETVVTGTWLKRQRRITKKSQWQNFRTAAEEILELHSIRLKIFF